jgi:hypothetical protein
VAETYDRTKPTIFVLTQERFLQRKDDLEIDLLFVDEFYKLDPDRGDSRFETLNLALYRAWPVAKQSIMAGPHIRRDDRTVTVNVIDRSANEDFFATFLADLISVDDESSLVFTATPNTAQKLMDDLVKSDVSYSSNLGQKLSAWIETNYHPGGQ